MFHLKSTGKKLEDYFWKKSKILEMFGIETTIQENFEYQAFYIEFRYKPTQSNVVSGLSHYEMTSMPTEAIKHWIDRAFEDAMFHIVQDIEQKVDDKEVKLVKPPSVASWAKGDAEPFMGATIESTYEPKKLTLEDLNEAVKQVKEHSNKYALYASPSYDYIIAQDGTTWKTPKPAENGGSTGMGLISQTFNMKQYVVCAKCDNEYILKTAIIHMNDEEGMTREEIADYLESQDLDLKMKQPASTGGE